MHSPFFIYFIKFEQKHCLILQTKPNVCCTKLWLETFSVKYFCYNIWFTKEIYGRRTHSKRLQFFLTLSFSLSTASMSGWKNRKHTLLKMNRILYFKSMAYVIVGLCVRISSFFFLVTWLVRSLPSHFSGV